MWGDNDSTPFVAFARHGLAQELDSVRREALAEVKIIASRDYARAALSSRLDTSSGRRLLSFLIILAGKEEALMELYSGSGPLSGLYRDISKRTLYRDIDHLKENALIKIEGDIIEAGVALMSQFPA